MCERAVRTLGCLGLSRHAGATEIEFSRPLCVSNECPESLFKEELGIGHTYLLYTVMRP